MNAKRNDPTKPATWRRLFKDNLCVEVTIKRIYVINRGVNGWIDEQVVDEWFKKYPIDKHHASRDGCRLGMADVVTGVKILKPGDVPETGKRNG